MIGIKTFLKLDCKYLRQGWIQGWQGWLVTSHFISPKLPKTALFVHFFISILYKNSHFHWKSNVSNQITTPLTNSECATVGQFWDTVKNCHHYCKISGSAMILVKLRNNISKIITNFIQTIIQPIFYNGF